MNRYKFVVLFAVSMLFLVLSSSQISRNIFAGASPTPTPSKISSPSDTTNHIYLSLVQKSAVPPPAPPMTTSRYVATTNPNTMDTAGCNQGLASESGTVILDFGYPYYDAQQQYYGTKLLSFGNPFVDSLYAEGLAWQFMQGWIRCAPPTKTLEVVLGLNNSSKFWQFTAEHGRDWALMATDLARFVSNSSVMAGRISVAGGMDIEFDWNQPTITRAWVNAFDPGGMVVFYNFGSCDGCPYFAHPNWQPNNYWQTEDIYYVSARTSDHGTFRFAFPEIYTTNGQNADQWYRVSLYGVNTYSWPLIFRGTLTQYYACEDSNMTLCANATPPHQ